MTSEYTGAEADEPIDHRDSQRPERCRGAKLETKGITCWLATDKGVDPSIADKMEVDGDSETSFNDETGTIKVSTSVFIKDLEGLPSSCEYDIYWSCSTPHSLWCRVYSRSPRGRVKQEAHIWMCSTKPTTQSRSTKYWSKRKLYCPKPLSSALPEDMGSIQLEMYKLKGPVLILDEAENDVKVDTSDDNAWIIFKFNFKWRVPYPSSISSLALVQTKRKREGSLPLTRSTRRRCLSQSSSSNAPHLESSPKVGSSNSSNGALVSEDEEPGSDHNSTSLRMAIKQANGHLRRRDLISSPSSSSSLSMATQESSESVSQAPVPSSGGVNQGNNSILSSNPRINSSGSRDGRAQAKILPLPEPTLVSSPDTSSNDGDHHRKEHIWSSTRLSLLPPMPPEPTSTASIASTSAQPVAQSVTALFDDVNEELERELKRLDAEIAERKKEARLIIETRSAELQEKIELRKRELAEYNRFIESSRQ